MLAIEKTKTALLVMDFQNDIVDPEGAFGRQGMAVQVAEKKAIENTARAIAAARSKEVPVIHVAVAFRPGHPEINPAVPLFAGIKKANALMEGSWGADFHPAVKPTVGELTVIKRGVSALAGTDLNQILRGRGISILVLAGIATNFVVEGTARDAADNGYQVIVLKDCCASFTDEMHKFSLSLLPQLTTLATVDEFGTAL
jgi:nicotinamidase-related amidase